MVTGSLGRSRHTGQLNCSSVHSLALMVTTSSSETEGKELRESEDPEAFRGLFSLDSQEETDVSQARAGRGELGGARAARQVERGKRVEVVITAECQKIKGVKRPILLSLHQTSHRRHIQIIWFRLCPARASGVLKIIFIFILLKN